MLLMILCLISFRYWSRS